MKTRIGINGFGRIGRNVFKAILKYHPSLEVVAINDHSSSETKAHLLKYDSIYGIFEKKVESDSKNLIVDGKSNPLFELIHSDWRVSRANTLSSIVVILLKLKLLIWYKLFHLFDILFNK